MIKNLLLIAFLIGFVDCFSQDLILKLNYQKTEDNTVWTKGNEMITIKSNHSLITNVYSDTNGVFIIPRSGILNTQSFDIFLASTGMLENFLMTINMNERDTLSINLPKKYSIQAGYAICPKCHRSDEVCKISTEPILIRRIVKGDTIYSPIDNRIYYSGTSVWHEFNPLWFCKRDSIKF